MKIRVMMTGWLFLMASHFCFLQVLPASPSDNPVFDRQSFIDEYKKQSREDYEVHARRKLLVEDLLKQELKEKEQEYLKQLKDPKFSYADKRKLSEQYQQFMLTKQRTFYQTEALKGKEFKKQEKQKYREFRKAYQAHLKESLGED